MSTQDETKDLRRQSRPLDPPICRCALAKIEEAYRDRALAHWRRQTRRRVVSAAGFMLVAAPLLAGPWVLYELRKGNPPALSGDALAAYGTVLAAFLAGVVAFYTAVVAPSRLRKLELSLSYVERQLSDLWGPLYGEIKAGGYYYAEVVKRMGLHVRRPLKDDPTEPGVVIRRAKASLDPFLLFDGSRGGGDRWKQWASFSDSYALAHNAKIASLLKNHQDLIGQDHIPDVQQFLAHEAEYRTKYIQFASEVRSRKIPAQVPRLDNLYPEAFEYHAYFKIRFLFHLQKKYRLELDGARGRTVRERLIKAAGYRARSVSSPPRNSSCGSCKPSG